MLCPRETGEFSGPSCFLALKNHTQIGRPLSSGRLLVLAWTTPPEPITRLPAEFRGSAPANPTGPSPSDHSCLVVLRNNAQFDITLAAFSSPLPFAPNDPDAVGAASPRPKHKTGLVLASGGVLWRNTWLRQAGGRMGSLAAIPPGGWGTNGCGRQKGVMFTGRAFGACEPIALWRLAFGEQSVAARGRLPRGPRPTCAFGFTPVASGPRFVRCATVVRDTSGCSLPRSSRPAQVPPVGCAVSTGLVRVNGSHVHIKSIGSACSVWRWTSSFATESTVATRLMASNVTITGPNPCKNATSRTCTGRSLNGWTA